MDVDLVVINFLRDHPNAPMAKIINAAMTAAEPLIRADEREQCDNRWAMVRTKTLTDLRAKVEALPFERRYTGGTEYVDRADVLALLDGSSDA
jgi:hypothetical protein